jgi:cystathionine beta-lyase/cystathionine gamma-synthase
MKDTSYIINHLGGHSDIVAGMVCGSSENIKRIFNNEYLGLGGILSPFNAWQMLKPTGLLSVKLKVHDKNKTELFVNSLKQFLIGVSWGGHESLVFPAMSFDNKRTKEGYSGNLVRFYVGLDEAESLINDLDQAFKKIM